RARPPRAGRRGARPRVARSPARGADRAGAGPRPRARRRRPGERGGRAMAALTRASLGGAARVRAAIPGEGFAIAALWRELWDAHQEWGGYPGSSDEAVYAQLAGRLDDDARVRGGRPLLGSHVHLIA